jgi:hypothetical protein
MGIELVLNRIVALLRSRHGWTWRRHTPADLTWILRTGVGLNEAWERVWALVDPGAPPSVSAEPHSDLTEAVGADVLPDRLAGARLLNIEHWKSTGKRISVESLRMRLNIGAEASRALARTLRAAEREAICAGTPGGMLASRWTPETFMKWPPAAEQCRAISGRLPLQPSFSIVATWPSTTSVWRWKAFLRGTFRA